MATATLTRLHRRDLRALTSQAEADLRTLWRDSGTAEAARDRLLVTLPRLVGVYGLAASTLGADYYDDVRDDLGVPGSFRAAPSEVVDDEALEVLARFAVGPLFRSSPDFGAALSLAAGGMQRHLADADRDSIRFASVEDSRARGWERVGGGGCDFCAMLIGRGAVYSEATADFESHDRCNCSAQPVFD